MNRYGGREWVWTSDPNLRDHQDMAQQGRDAASRIAVSKRVRGMKYTWWVDRLIGMPSTFQSRASASHGRKYVVDRKARMAYMRKGEVRVGVQVANGYIYWVDIRIDTVDESGLKALAAALLARPAAASKIASGQMPDDIEKVFAAAGLRLLPGKADSTVRCMCGRMPGPCVHVGAAVFLLADRLERNPFLIFRLRGFERDDLLGAAGLKPVHKTGSKNRRQHKAEPLPADPDAFWGADHGTHNQWDASIPATHAVLPKHLGGFPFWRGEEDFVGAMEHIYSMASQEGMSVLRGEIDLQRSMPSPYD